MTIRTLKRGKAKNILAAAIDSALLAVEIYNKPRATFRTEAFISLMIIAWTRLFHCHFYQTVGDRFYFKEKNSQRYKKVNGERMAWDLGECIKVYTLLKPAVVKNLELFIQLRNKVEHRYIDKREFDTLLFGECQSLLFNFETQLIDWFGESYALNENLVFSLQFSTLRQSTQNIANKKALSADLVEIKHFIDTYRSSLPCEVFNSELYSIKLIQIPKISNTNRNDIAIEFVNWSNLEESDKLAYQQVTALIKDKIVKQPVINCGGMKPSKIRQIVEAECGIKLSDFDHKCLYVIFNVRPDPSDSKYDPFNTEPEYCLYDEVHNDYIYFQAWADKLVELLCKGKLKKHIWTQAYRKQRRLEIADYI